MNNFDIAVAVSGGLDSLMAMCLLKDAGHKLLAVHGLFASDSDESRLDALRGSCASLDIPLQIVDLQKVFAQKVINTFIAAYAAGQTPNPCVTCNRDIKFGLFMDAALALGAKRLATGHYARKSYFHTPQGDYLTLARASDTSKDQAYFLGLVPPDNLHRIEFPLADYRKADLRLEAARRGLQAPETQESQEICFIPNDDYRAFLLDKAGAAMTPGPILLPDGRQVGQHNGLWQYTEGQRRGLGLAHSEALYVIGKDTAQNALLVGTKKDLYLTTWRAVDLNIHVPPEFWPANLLVRTRYRQTPQPATAKVHGHEAEITFLTPHERPAPGQLTVIYTPDGLMLAAGIGADRK